MESEKVKEIKKALEYYTKEGCFKLPYLDGDDAKQVYFSDILALIKQLEGENKSLYLSERVSYYQKENALIELDLQIRKNEDELATTIYKLLDSCGIKYVKGWLQDNFNIEV